jgi:outer membrane lipopolysaccharide assembly protein LptE/RlpB
MVLSPVLTAPYVNAADAEFKADLTKALNRSGIMAVNDPDNASAIIDLVSVKYDRQVLSINSRGQATGYILTYEVLCRFVDRAGRVLTSPARLKLSRTLEYQSIQVLQKKQEEDALRARMRDDLVQQILRRLNSVSQAPPGGLKTERFS